VGMCVVVLALLAVALAALLGTLPLYVNPHVEKPQMDTAIYATAETPGATLYNLAVFFTLLVVATAAIYLLLTRRRLLNPFLYFVWFTLALGVVQFYAWLYYSYGILPPGPATWAILLSPAVGVLVVFLLSRRRGDLFLGFLGALAGSMFVWLLPSVTVLALLVALPVYDYLMVSRGLLGRLIKKAKEGAASGNGATPPKGRDTPLFGFVVRLRTFSLGVGDFVVYSMALSFIAARLAAFGGAVALAAVALGVASIYAGLRLTVEIFLKRWGYGPALPLPMLLLSPLIAAAWLT